jgi:hypothetical protein
VDEATILPDGSNWSEQTDMARFTDDGHAEFWYAIPPPTAE